MANEKNIKQKKDIKANWMPNRYGFIEINPKREIVMLRGVGCFHKKCKFCDYHLDRSTNVLENFELNKKVLDCIIGKYDELEVICSGSVQELDFSTIYYIKDVCINYGIKKLSLECHYNYRETLKTIKNFFMPIEVSFRVGVESFDYNWRENIMRKGMGDISPYEISKYFDYCNLLVGEENQTKEQILNDIELGKKYFKRICIGVLDENGTGCKRDENIVKWFVDELSDELKRDERFHILIENEDFPLGDGSMTEKGC